ncbi:hypothetical protein B0H11DRAFT_2239163 [Mycena galericulata]|nr:hypothetical protein B0H11DRAFT_2239163 [Mycena galericulata]
MPPSSDLSPNGSSLTNETPIIAPSPTSETSTIIPSLADDMLPACGTKGAPLFDGEALSLHRYWEDIEELAEQPPDPTK